MTPLDFYKNLKDFIKSMVWTGTSNKIFGDAVHIVPTLPQRQLYGLNTPSCFIIAERVLAHEQNAQLLTAFFSLAIMVKNDTDRFSESTLIGGCREDDTSKGAGMFELELEFYKKLTETYSLDSQKVYIVENGSSIITEGGRMKQTIIRFYRGSILLEV